MSGVTVASNVLKAREWAEWSAHLRGLPEGTQLMVDGRYFEKQDADWNDWLWLDSGRPYDDSICTDSRFVNLCQNARSVIVPLERHP